MSRMLPTHAKAKSYTRISQAGAAVLVLSAVALGVFGLPGGLPPTAISEQTPDPVLPTGGTQPTTTPERVDLGGVAERIILVDNRPEQESDSPSEDPVDIPVQSTGPLRYLGMIEEPGRVLALIEIDGRQRFVPAGEAIDGEFELVLVTPDAMVIRTGNDEREIEKATRRSQSFGQAQAQSSAPSRVPPTRAGGGPGRANTPANRDEYRARRLERSRELDQEFDQDRGLRDRQD